MGGKTFERRGKDPRLLSAFPMFGVLGQPAIRRSFTWGSLISGFGHMIYVRRCRGSGIFTLFGDDDGRQRLES